MRKFPLFGLAAGMMMAASSFSASAQEYTLSPESGTTQKELTAITVEWPGQNVLFYENMKIAVAVLTNNSTGSEYVCEQAHEIAQPKTSIYTLVFKSQDNLGAAGEEDVEAVTEPGEYTLTIRGMYLADENGEEVEALAPITASYTIEYPVGYTLNPAPGVATDLQGMLLTFDELVLFSENDRMPSVTLSNLTTGDEFTADPLRNTNATEGTIQYILNFVDEDGDWAYLTQPGEYLLTVKSMYTQESDEADPVYLPVIKANYTIAYPLAYELTPAEGVATDLMNITINFPDTKDVLFYENSPMPVAVLENIGSGKTYICEEPVQNTRYMTEGIAYDMTFVPFGEEDAEPITEEGAYKLTIKAMYHGDYVDYPVLYASYYIAPAVAYNLVPANGAYVENLMQVTVEFPEDNTVAFYENNRMPVAVLVNVTTGKVYNCQEADRNTMAETEGVAYTLTFIGEDDEEAMAITEPGQYELTIRALYHEVDGEMVDINNINANYQIASPVAYALYPDNGATVENLQGITIQFPENNNVAFYENNRMPVAVLENVTTGKIYNCLEADRNTFATEGCEYTLTFIGEDDEEAMAITEPGHYKLTVRAMYLESNEEGVDNIDLPVINAEYNIAYPVVYYLNPDNGANVENLQGITIQFPDNEVMFYENNRMPVAVLENVTTGKIYNCQDADRNVRATEGTEYTLTFVGENDEEAMDITEPGQYKLTVRGMYIPSAEEDGDNTDLPVINAEYTIAYPVVYYLNPDNGATVENLMTVTIQFPENTNVEFYENNRVPVAVLENTTTGKIYNCQEPDRNTRATEGCEYTFTFIGEDDEEAMAITEPGQYTMAIRAMYIPSEEEDGDNTDLPVITANYTIAYPVAYYLNPDNGATVENLQSITIQFPENTNVAFYENNRMPVAVLENVNTGKIYNCQEADRNTFATEGCEYTFTFIGEDDEEAMAITEPGQYKLTVRAMYLESTEEGGDNIDLPVINAEYNIAYPVAYYLNPDNGATVENLQGITIQFPENTNVAFYENNRMPVAVLENVTTGTLYNCQEADRNTFATEGCEYTFTFLGEDDEEAMAITEPGQYKLTVRAMYLESDEEGVDNIDLPVLYADYTIAYPVVYYLNPDNGAYVENLMTVSIQFPENTNVAFYENNRMPVAVLENTTTGSVYNCQEADKNVRATEGCEYTFTFIGEDDEEAMAITEPGQYKLTVRALYLESTEEGVDNVDLPVINAEYTIAYPVAYYLNPDNGATVEDLMTVTIEFPENKNVTFYENNRMATVALENTTTGAIYYAEPVRDTRAMTEGVVYTMTFINEDAEEAAPITEAGQYVMTIKALCLTNEEGEIEEDLPVITANYTIEYPVEYILTPDNGAKVEDLMTINIEFPMNNNVQFFENNQMPVAVLVNNTTGVEYFCMEADRDTHAMTEGVSYNMTFIAEGEEEAAPITELGDYTLTIRALALVADGEFSSLPVITANYTIPYPVEYVLTPDNGATVEDLMTVAIEFPVNKVMFYEGSQIPVAVLVNNTTGAEYVCQEADRNTFAMTEDGTAWTLTFIAEGEEEAAPITEMGEYTLTIRALGLVIDDELTVLPVITANYSINYPVEYVLTPVEDSTVECIDMVQIEFPYNKNIGFYENNPMPVAVLENVTTGTTYACESPERNTFAETEGIAYIFRFINQETDEYAETIDENGDYVLTIRAFGFVNEEGEVVEDLPVITATYYILNTDSVEAIYGLGDDVFNVYNLNGIQLVKNGNAADVQGLDAGLYIINGKKVLIRK